ncbi:hypothetical protein BDP27DRAFT_1327923 [Rhodocollybia butyracea]|uniref:LIM zinc-binding domain-containing protein n=1 Tax=Rhodocollybia butyracea TaxID=206335 RepID=A0A9P5PLT2_9AGAR|nr:hypothetical protein BDP27DRAFT_1327923 [Rhodocollybia butyracea]
MGFCRRCGEIVSSAAGDRCKCGGTAVAPVVAWKEKPNDPWAKTYVSKSPSRKPQPIDTSAVKSNTTGTSSSSSSPTKRFPRPLSSYSSSSSNPIAQRVTEHITATTSQINRPPSPLKNSTVISPESGILPSLNSHSTGSLSKVYGSVLQSKESLASHACAFCGTAFPPDSTIYPEPYGEASKPMRFLCRDCFALNGGAKGDCPGCSRAVLALKSEGPYIQAGGAYWHKGCFTCEGCGTNIGDSPMVDLLGKPSCAECFDSCLKRDSTPKKNRTSTARMDSPMRNLGGLSSPDSKSREGSPAMEELEQRLGIVKSRQSSPALEELSQRLSMLATSPKINRYDSLSRSPSPRRPVSTLDSSPLLNRSERLSRTDTEESRNRASLLIAQLTGLSSPSSPVTADQVEEMKQRFMKSTSSSQASPAHSPPSSVLRSRLRISRSSGSLSSFPNKLLGSPSEAGTPDLISDYSDSATQSSVGPDSPPRLSGEGDDAFLVAKLYGRGLGTRYARSGFLEDTHDVIIEETNSQLNTPDNTPKHKSLSSTKTTPVTTPSKAPVPRKPLPKPRSTGSRVEQTASQSNSCAKCHKQLFSVREGGRYLTVPDDTGALKTYHTACFTCSVCGLEFQQGAQQQAAFVKGKGGPCHVDCVPPAKIAVPKAPDPPTQALPVRRTHTISKSISSLSSPSPPSSPNSNSYVSSSAPILSSSSSASSLRFGSSNACPGCNKSVPQVFFGISEGERSVQGPNGTRWHIMCLVCGGRKKPAKGVLRGRDERRKGEPGCGKRLDSAAKTDGENAVYCRECWLLLPAAPTSSQWSPTRAPLALNKVAPQYTGTTTLARQFTGLSGGDGNGPLLKQLTGGGLSPTRSLSPTKQLGSFRPRPKSVIGMRSSKSVDEGRGMFLVRQMTGTGDNQ